MKPPLEHKPRQRWRECATSNHTSLPLRHQHFGRNLCNPLLYTGECSLLRGANRWYLCQAMLIAFSGRTTSYQVSVILLVYCCTWYQDTAAVNLEKRRTQYCCHQTGHPALVCRHPRRRNASPPTAVIRCCPRLQNGTAVVSIFF